MSPRLPTIEQILDIATFYGMHLTEEDAAIVSRPDGRTDRILRAGRPARRAETPGQIPARARLSAGPRREHIQRLVLENEHQGQHKGVLAGKTVAVKDNICVAGVPMMNGSRVLEGYVPEIDATVVTRVLEAGGTITGKAACEDLCFSAGSHTCATGPIRNPHNPEHSTGGSSGGSAALVAAERGRHGARWRSGRLDPHAVLLVRRVRPQADLGTRPDDRRHADLLLGRSLRPDLRLDRRRRAAPDRDRRTRRLRPAHHDRQGPRTT